MEAIAQQPLWVQIWLNWMLFAVFLLPLVLLIWKPTRATGIIALGASVLAGAGIQVMFSQMGYVRLLGLPHLVFWIPLAVFLWAVVRRSDIPGAARIIIWVMLATILVSLAFDVTDVARYLAGKRAPMAVPDA